MRVFVYWNLHRGLWSVKALDGPCKGKVIWRTREVILTDAVGKVSEAGRQRVLRERKKNVHAGIVGTLYNRGGEHQDRLAQHVWKIGDKVTYNPYKYSQFVHAVDESPFEGSFFALLTADRAVFVA